MVPFLPSQIEFLVTEQAEEIMTLIVNLQGIPCVIVGTSKVRIMTT